MPKATCCEWLALLYTYSHKNNFVKKTMKFQKKKSRLIQISTRRKEGCARAVHAYRFGQCVIHTRVHHCTICTERKTSAPKPELRLSVVVHSSAEEIVAYFMMKLLTIYASFSVKTLQFFAKLLQIIYVTSAQKAFLGTSVRKKLGTCCIQNFYAISRSSQTHIHTGSRTRAALPSESSYGYDVNVTGVTRYGIRETSGTRSATDTSKNCPRRSQRFRMTPLREEIWIKTSSAKGNSDESRLCFCIKRRFMKVLLELRNKEHQHNQPLNLSMRKNSTPSTKEEKEKVKKYKKYTEKDLEKALESVFFALPAVSFIFFAVFRLFNVIFWNRRITLAWVAIIMKINMAIINLTPEDLIHTRVHHCTICTERKTSAPKPELRLSVVVHSSVSRNLESHERRKCETSMLAFRFSEFFSYPCAGEDAVKVRVDEFILCDLRVLPFCVKAKSIIYPNFFSHACRMRNLYDLHESPFDAKAKSTFVRISFRT
ncbi:unnamed protein product [Trichogramma brassicae]|uniref:Uncharacterized protein n=1 Tax=Trichogramma brassicae TaxID=86971 RepID=A0A6H5J2L0_9HYME|nr:unnamed protein product [Trichogramma brassicae]